jgi:hypothetical protein
MGNLVIVQAQRRPGRARRRTWQALQWKKERHACANRSARRVMRGKGRR